MRQPKLTHKKRIRPDCRQTNFFSPLTKVCKKQSMHFYQLKKYIPWYGYLIKNLFGTFIVSYYDKKCNIVSIKFYICLSCLNIYLLKADLCLLLLFRLAPIRLFFSYVPVIIYFYLLNPFKLKFTTNINITTALAVLKVIEPYFCLSCKYCLKKLCMPYISIIHFNLQSASSLTHKHYSRI